MIQMAFDVSGETAYKVCKICGRTLPLTMYNVQRYKLKSGEPTFRYYSECRDCRKADHKKRYAENKERYKGHVLDFIAKYGTFYQQKQRAAKRHLKHDLTTDQVDEMDAFFGGCCAYCGAVLKDVGRTYEHLVLARDGGGFTKSNIIPACRRCNIERSTHDWRVWYRQSDYYDKGREAKILEYIGEAII